MSVIRWIAGAVIFVLLLLFSLQNAQLVPLTFYGLLSWHAPLVFLLLIAFALGMAAGLLAGVTRTLRLKRQINRMRREHARPSELAVPPIDAR
jgi:lipopolysaccharide assembly protein A